MKYLLMFVMPLAKWGVLLLTKRFVDKLPDSQTKIDLTVLFARILEFVDKVTDSNPDDAAQLDALWKEVVGSDLSASATARIQKIVDGIDDERLSRTILVVSRPGIDVLRLVSDDVKDDVAQIKARFLEFAANDDVHDLVLYDWLEPTLTGKGVPDFVIGMILETIADAIQGALEPGVAKTLSVGNQAVIRHLRERSAALTKASLEAA